MISIVMAYYNRLPQLQATLESISESSIASELEVIIVDDGSLEDQKASLVEVIPYPFKLNIIYLDPKDKDWVNPCIPFNIGFKAATGDKIIIQNPECYHYTDIPLVVNNVLQENLYLSFPCYSLNEETTEKVKSVDIKDLPNRAMRFDGDLGWYNHIQHRPVYYHFCSAIMKSDLDELGGFDERYAKGKGFDDNEFLVRIHRMGMDIGVPERDLVLHQWHYTGDIATKRNAEWNSKLFHEVTMKEEGYKVNEN